MKHTTSVVKSLPALLTLTGGMCLGAGNAGATVQPSLESRIDKINRQLNTQPAQGAVQHGQEAASPMFFPWPNWHNGGWRNWHNWHNWHNW